MTKFTFLLAFALVLGSLAVADKQISSEATCIVKAGGHTFDLSELETSDVKIKTENETLLLSLCRGLSVQGCQGASLCSEKNGVYKNIASSESIVPMYLNKTALWLSYSGTPCQKENHTAMVRLTCRSSPGEPVVLQMKPCQYFLSWETSAVCTNESGNSKSSTTPSTDDKTQNTSASTNGQSTTDNPHGKDNTTVPQHHNPSTSSPINNQNTSQKPREQEISNSTTPSIPESTSSPPINSSPNHHSKSSTMVPNSSTPIPSTPSPNQGSNYIYILVGGVVALILILGAIIAVIRCRKSR